MVRKWLPRRDLRFIDSTLWGQNAYGDNKTIGERLTMSYQQAVDCLERGELHTALALLDRVISIDSQHLDAYRQRGRTRLKLGHGEGAAADYSKVIRLDPRATDYVGRALAYLASANATAALLDATQAVALDPQLASAQRLLGKVQCQLGQTQAAVAAYKTATKLYLAQKDKANAADCLEQANQIQAQVMAPVSAPVAEPLISTTDFLQRAREKAAQGKLRQAVADLDWLLTMEPDQVEALCDRAYLNAKLHRREVATQDMAKALQLAPNDVTVQVKRAKIRLALGDAQGAMVDLTGLIKAEATAQRLGLRGQAYQQLGDFDNAFKDYANALAIQPSADLYDARAAVQSGKEALADYRQAASLWLDQGNWQASQVSAQRAENLRQQLDREKSEAADQAARLIRVPIKSKNLGIPIIEVRFNDRYTFDMCVDTGASRTLISESMASLLQIKPTPGGYMQTADGRSVPMGSGWVRSMRVQTAVVMNVQVAIAPAIPEGLLGQDFFAHYDIRVLTNEIEFYRR